MLPPLHKVDGPIEFVLVEDEVWDRERIKEEVRELSAEETAEHPWYQYHSGETRFDLKQAAGLFREGEKPTVFTLRRLDYHQWRQVSEVAQTSEMGANDLALVLGLVSIKNGDETVDLRGPTSEKRRLTDGDFKKLIGLLGHERVQEVGKACRTASEDLTASEKKA